MLLLVYQNIFCNKKDSSAEAQLMWTNKVLPVKLKFGTSNINDFRGHIDNIL